MTGLLVVLATFVAAGVEWVEALTIVLAVGTFRSWRTALLGTAAALATLVVLVAVFGFAVSSNISLPTVRTVVGVGLLLFGLGWLYKAILRSTGLKGLHDEQAAYDEAKQELMSHGHAFGMAYAGVFLEGLEVVFIVVALGGLRSQTAAVLGAVASLAVVVVAGVFARQPLTRVPENTLKYAVGVMLSSFGTFFAGEGLGVQWWRDDAVLLILIPVYAVASILMVAYIRNADSFHWSQISLLRPISAATKEVWGLFVTDGMLAALGALALLLVTALTGRFGLDRSAAGWLLVVCICLAVAISVGRAARTKVKVSPKHLEALSQSTRVGDVIASSGTT